MVFLFGIWTLYSRRIGLPGKGSIIKGRRWDGLSPCSGRAQRSDQWGLWFALGQSDLLLLWGWSYCCLSKSVQVSWGQVRFPRAYSHMYLLTIPPSLTSEMFFASRGTHSLVLRAPPKLFTSGNSFGLRFNSYYSSSSAGNLTNSYFWPVLLWRGISETWNDLPKAHSFPIAPLPFLSGGPWLGSFTGCWHTPLTCHRVSTFPQILLQHRNYLVWLNNCCISFVFVTKL